MSYIRQLGLDPNSQAGPPGPSCFICDAVEHPDKQHLVLVNDERGVILLNKYPYINGHLLAAPRSHVELLSDLSRAQRADLMELTELSDQMLRLAMNPQGMNVGINIGRCAGAGLPGHLHVHVVPRWSGDTNYMETIGRVRVIPQALEECYDLLADTLGKLPAQQ